MGYGEIVGASSAIAASGFATGMGWIIAGAVVVTIGIALALRFYFRKGRGIKQ